MYFENIHNIVLFTLCSICYKLWYVFSMFPNIFLQRLCKKVACLIESRNEFFSLQQCCTQLTIVYKLNALY